MLKQSEPRARASGFYDDGRRRSIQQRSSGFTLVELLVSIAIISILIGILLPSLSMAHKQAKQVTCAAHLAQLARAFHAYAAEHLGMSMPLAYTDPNIIGDGPPIFWWGTNAGDDVDHTRGFVWPYLGSDLRARGVYECPQQPWGSYIPQGAARAITSTYGYNGYYLSPPHTPGWSFQIGHRPWQNVDHLIRPQRIFAFADTAADLGAALPHNNALLDPPLLFQGGGRWAPNTVPTTSFRHDGRAVFAFADGHTASVGADEGDIVSQRFGIGSVGRSNDPHYVPDWRDW